uniref:BED-type domain-containing protein n=1 Tax=Acrobeloides nanus TaxID=290746 RepID=A0A914D9T5_9BILA
MTKSEVWQYFIKEGNDVICNKCKKAVSGLNTTNLWNHLNHSHPEIYKLTEHSKKKQGDGELDEPPTKKAKQHTLQAAFGVSNRQEQDNKFKNLILEFIIDNNLPISIVESETFKNLVRFNSPDIKIPSRQEITYTLIPKRANSVKKNITESLANQKIALTTDTFSNKSNSLICVTSSWLTRDFQLKNRVIAIEPLLEHHTGVNISERIQKILTEFNVDLNDIVLMTRDGASNMEVACRKLNIPSLHCLCHILHLVVKMVIMKHIEVFGSVARAQAIVNSFKRSPSASHELRILEGDDARSLLLGIETRWNSFFHMLESVIRAMPYLRVYGETYKNAATNAIKMVSEGDVSIINTLLPLLKLFEDATLILSAEKASISCYLYVIKVLTRALESLEQSSDSELIQVLAREAKADLTERTEGCFEMESLKIAAFLDPRIKQRALLFEADKWREIENTVIEKLVNLKSDNDTAQGIQNNDATTVRDSNCNVVTNNPWDVEDSNDACAFVTLRDELKAEIALYIKAERLNVINPLDPGHSNVYGWWRKHRSSFPNLAILAREYLAPSPSSCASERAFSKATLHYSNKLRSRLKPTLSGQILMIQTDLADKRRNKDRYFYYAEEPDDEDLELYSLDI